MKNDKKKLLKVPYAFSLHGKEEVEAVSRVINEHRTMLGEETRVFEKEIAKLFKKKYGVMVNSGSSANLLAFEMLNLPQGSEVITPILTFNTTVSPIIKCGLTPVFVDILPDTYLINIDDIEKKINKKTKALMIPSLIGNVPDFSRLRAIARKHRLYLIEDSCDTLGATFLNRSTGAYSDISTTSFYGSHVINAGGGGGMICVNNKEWHKRLLLLRGWGRTSSLFADSEDVKKRFSTKLNNIPYDGKFIFTEYGYNFLPLEISAAFGRAQLKKLPVFSKIRQKNFVNLYSFFAKWPQFLRLPKQTLKSKTNWLAFPLIITEAAPFSRLELVKFLEQNNIQTRPVFTGNILRQPIFTSNKMKNFLFEETVNTIKASNNPNEYSVADDVMKNAFLIGCHQGITRKHLDYIKKTFEKFFLSYV